MTRWLRMSLLMSLQDEHIDYNVGGPRCGNRMRTKPWPPMPAWVCQRNNDVTGKPLRTLAAVVSTACSCRTVTSWPNRLTFLKESRAIVTSCHFIFLNSNNLWPPYLLIMCLPLRTFPGRHDGRLVIACQLSWVINRDCVLHRRVYTSSKRQQGCPINCKFIYRIHDSATIIAWQLVVWLAEMLRVGLLLA